MLELTAIMTAFSLVVAEPAAPIAGRVIDARSGRARCPQRLMNRIVDAGIRKRLSGALLDRRRRAGAASDDERYAQGRDRLELISVG